ncbi:MAG: Crp/Fnr family transcriptional regulator [Acidobacteria bacterium]|nr:Crp/Fnr family transcriptional regulator [Acidobacteriota bacterium]
MQFISANGLLSALPPVIYERLEPNLQRVRLEAGGVLFEAGAPIDYTWFITSGIVSLLCVTEDGDSIEVAMAGHDSVIGFPGIVRKSEAAFRAQAPIAGEALRVSARVLQAAIRQDSQVYLPLLDHTHILYEQIAQATVCSRFHTTDQRLARWLLLARDRTRYGVFNLTHEAMARILGVSRSGVSSAAGLLQMKGLIRYARGRITLLNPEGLEVFSCECYRILSRTIKSLLLPDNWSATDRVTL